MIQFAAGAVIGIVLLLFAVIVYVVITEDKRK